MKLQVILGAVLLASLGVALAQFQGFMPQGPVGFGYPGGQSSFLSQNMIFVVVLFFFLFIMTMNTSTTTTSTSTGGVTVMDMTNGNTPPF